MTEPAVPATLLAVAACAGHRCAALRAGSVRPGALRAAVRARPSAVLIELPCVGACDRACVVAAGPVVAHEGRLSWLAQPAQWELTERDDQDRRLCRWIATAPVPAPAGRARGADDQG